MVDVFADYEQEFAEIKASLKMRIAAIPTVKGEERDKEKRGAEVDLVAGRELIEKMEVGAGDDPRLEAKVEGFKRELKSITGLYRKAVAKSDYEVERESLIGGVALHDIDVTSQDHRQRAQEATARLAATGARIDDSMRLAEETAAVVTGSLGELGRQRQTIEHSMGRMDDIDGDISQARRLIRTMARRMMTNKAIAIMAIIFLVVMISLIIYFKWIRKLVPADHTSTGWEMD
eukprot:m51a1_g177 putative vesicle transport through interaction with t-snares 1 (233) ;mRNA; f:587963-588971